MGLAREHRPELGLSLAGRASFEEGAAEHESRGRRELGHEPLELLGDLGGGAAGCEQGTCVRQHGADESGVFAQAPLEQVDRGVQFAGLAFQLGQVGHRDVAAAADGRGVAVAGVAHLEAPLKQVPREGGSAQIHLTQGLLQDEVGEPGEALQAFFGAFDRLDRAPAGAQGLDEAARERRCELEAPGVGLEHAPGLLQLGDRGLRFSGGRILGA